MSCEGKREGMLCQLKLLYCIQYDDDALPPPLIPSFLFPLSSLLCLSCLGMQIVEANSGQDDGVNSGKTETNNKRKVLTGGETERHRSEETGE